MQQRPPSVSATAVSNAKHQPLLEAAGELRQRFRLAGQAVGWLRLLDNPLPGGLVLLLWRLVHSYESIN
jgi:hypothetical protein